MKRERIVSKNIPETINIFRYEKTLYDFSEFGIRGLSKPFVISNESEKPPKRMANINFGIFGGAVRSINFLVGEFYEKRKMPEMTGVLTCERH